jgi:hypothetical protein
MLAATVLAAMPGGVAHAAKGQSHPAGHAANAQHPPRGWLAGLKAGWKAGRTAGRKGKASTTAVTEPAQYRRDLVADPTRRQRQRQEIVRIWERNGLRPVGVKQLLWSTRLRNVDSDVGAFLDGRQYVRFSAMNYLGKPVLMERGRSGNGTRLFTLSPDGTALISHSPTKVEEIQLDRLTDVHAIPFSHDFRYQREVISVLRGYELADAGYTSETPGDAMERARRRPGSIVPLVGEPRRGAGVEVWTLRVNGLGSVTATLVEARDNFGQRRPVKLPSQAKPDTVWWTHLERTWSASSMPTTPDGAPWLGDRWDGQESPETRSPSH